MKKPNTTIKLAINNVENAEVVLRNAQQDKAHADYELVKVIIEEMPHDAAHILKVNMTRLRMVMKHN